jgi:ABC-2 type transport system ATP-binding protein
MANSGCDDVMSNLSKTPLVQIENLNLKYQISHNQAKSLRETLINFAKRESIISHHLALQDVSFSLNEGEVLAIVGRNGAGKSTLLKCIARVLPPTSGRVITRGTVAPLIELGAGFHPDMTGRENAVLYGAVLGRSVKIMQSRISEIAEWSGLGKFIDLPIRTYSSGMLSRLSFAVATDRTPDILIIDEVLSVGDAEFQKKSRLRINEIMAKSSTVIVVSHDISTLSQLGTVAIWLEAGSIASVGSVEEVIRNYQSKINENNR